MLPDVIASSDRRLVDTKNNRVWSLSADGLWLSEPSRRQSIAVSLPGWNALNAQYSAPPAFTLGPNSELVVTSNVIATLWRIDAKSLAISAHPLLLNPNTEKEFGFYWLSYSPEEGAYFAYSEQLESLWRIDRQLHNGQWVATLLPVHWATFNLAYHEWAEPIVRILSAANAKGATVITPRIGERFEFGQAFENSNWFRPPTAQ